MLLVPLLILVISVLVGGNNGQNDVIVTRCCVPSQFRCEMDVTGGYTDPVSGMNTFADRRVRLYNDYDLNVTRTDTDVSLPSGVSFVHSELTYYDQHISYKIDGSQCRPDRITAAMQDKCIPGYAVLVTTGRIGQSGGDGIEVATWRYVTSDNITILRAVSVEQCWPIYQTEQSVFSGGYSRMTYMISNIEVGKFPDLITKPDICTMT
ncbi:uncharacterized protein LOC132543858 [Ylistrum balloti]|uniref:uncharacterized protein LOC132543858 n=1 Tax=Ylistrum balloti TaxID=509963 RepID=UPI0029058C5A|nr:uncharacterized protein LOC132543858 [Ylistrum balloti]